MVRKKTKIVATIGPSSNTEKMIQKMASEGANVVRLNFSHGTHEDHKKVINTVRKLNEETNYNLSILQDLQGPKIRVGDVAENGVLLREKETLIITTQECIGSEKKVSTPYINIVKDVRVNDTILIDDGNIELMVTGKNDHEVITKIIHGGVLKSKKGINLPNTKISESCLTEKDREDMKFGLENNVDWIALSFVRKAEDILQVKNIIYKTERMTKVIAKIEKPEALKNIDKIIDVADGIMVARGDLGVETPMHRVPIWQKRIVKKCIKEGKPVIIATQMMESMIENSTPTRAEVNDVANAVLDGADALMLSAESASGKYPVETVKKMSKTIVAVEKSIDSIYSKNYEKNPSKDSHHMPKMLIRSACRLADNTGAKALVSITKSGYTGFRIARHRPKSRIYLFTDNKKLLYQLSLLWGVETFYFSHRNNIDQTFSEIEKKLVKIKKLKQGDMYINTAPMPQHWDGHTNMLRISVVS